MNINYLSFILVKLHFWSLYFNLCVVLIQRYIKWIDLPAPPLPES